DGLAVVRQALKEPTTIDERLRCILARWNGHLPASTVWADRDRPGPGRDPGVIAQAHAARVDQVGKKLVLHPGRPICPGRPRRSGVDHAISPEDDTSRDSIADPRHHHVARSSRSPATPRMSRTSTWPLRHRPATWSAGTTTSWT